MSVEEAEAEELSTVEKFILMALYARPPGGKGGKLRLQKIMFKLAEVFEELREELDFEPYSYGPYSEAVEEYRSMLENSGLISNTELTEEGQRLAEKVWRQADEHTKKVVKSIVEFIEALEDDELLLYIYVTSPDMAEKSTVRENVMKNRVEIALRMLRKGVISIGMAAKLAGLPLNEMIKRAIERNIKPFEAVVPSD